MKLAILLATGLSALALSGCVEERRGYGGGYGYERSTVVIGEDRGYYRRDGYRDRRGDDRRNWNRGRDDRRADRGDDRRGRDHDRGDRRRGDDNWDNNNRRN